MTNNGIWADKFIKREQLPAGDLAQRFNIHNPRTHPETQRQATESSLDTVGWIDEISLSTNGNGPPSLADNPDAVMFDGHERVEIALVRGGPDTLVPVRWYQLTPEETDFALLAKDQTSAMAQIDPVKMSALMERTKAMTEAPGLQGMVGKIAAEIGYREEELTESVEKLLTPKKYLRVLVSIPVDEAISARGQIEAISKIPGVEIDYGAN